MQEGGSSRTLPPPPRLVAREWHSPLLSLGFVFLFFFPRPNLFIAPCHPKSLPATVLLGTSLRLRLRDSLQVPGR